MRRSVLICSLLAVLLASLGMTAPVAQAAPSWGTVKVVVSAPAGVPATVLVSGATQKVAAKPPTGTSRTVALTFAPGTYRVQPQALTFEGDSYGTRVSASSATVRAGKTTTVYVTYFGLPSAADLKVGVVDTDSVALDWTAPAGATFRLVRRVVDPQTGLARRGKLVPVTGTSVVDEGLRAGTTYDYSLYTSVSGRWTGPLKMTAGTAAPAGSPDAAAYAAASDTLVATAEDIGAVSRTGSGVRMTLAAGEAPRLLGSAVVLPPSEILEGGFLGRVAAVSADGRTVDLVPTGIGDAFDYYSIDVPEFGDLDEAEVTAAEQPVEPPTLEERRRAAEEPADIAPAGLQAECETSGPSASVTYSPSIKLGGSLKVDVRTRTWANIPVGATMDMSVTAKATGAVAVATGGSATCSLDLPKFTRQITAVPVPITLVLEPVAEFTVEGDVEVSNIGLTATAGMSAGGSIDGDGVDFTGSRILEAQPLTPEVTANGGIGITLGGALSLGPGVATEKAGVMAGLQGELGIIEAELSATFAVSDPRHDVCTEARFGGSISVGLTVEAWLGPWDFEYDIEVPGLNGEWNYLPKAHLPAGCEDTPPPTESLLGNGVDKVSDQVGGGGTQWGRVEGFVPGEETWVLSTGNFTDILGENGDYVSTDLGKPGDADLAALAGYETRDAVYYETTLVPTGDTLHVQYVFATEEYPMYVGSEYNDVVGVFVDGVNCATVPGTSEPVSVNTVNDQVNPGYFIDNLFRDYPIALNGLTVPLGCAVPVTPGDPVTVRIAVADASDAIYDSAVALVDQGIWSD